jgi:hypothetical protein
MFHYIVLCVSCFACQTDQFGVLHAPVGQARALLVEHAAEHAQLQIAVHDEYGYFLNRVVYCIRSIRSCVSIHVCSHANHLHATAVLRVCGLVAHHARYIRIIADSIDHSNATCRSGVIHIVTPSQLYPMGEFSLSHDDFVSVHE